MAHEGDCIVAGSRDPEHDAARALLARGVTGSATTLEAERGAPRMTFDIEAYAATRMREDSAGGLRTVAYEPFNRPARAPGMGVLPPNQAEVHLDSAETETAVK